MGELNDNCPKWAAEMIDQLRQVEIYLGNIPKTLAWDSAHLSEVMKRTFEKDQAVFSEEKAEILFSRIVKGLHQEGISVEQIVAFINARIGYAGGPPYCGVDDVKGNI